MRKYKLFLLVVLFVASCQNNGYAQFVRQPPKGSDRFYDANIKESMRVLYKLEITFKYPIGERNKENKIISIVVTEMSARSRTTGNGVFFLEADKAILHKWEQDFWDRYSAYIIDKLYKNPPQPYNDKGQIEEYRGLKMIRYGGVFIATPEK